MERKFLPFISVISIFVLIVFSGCSNMNSSNSVSPEELTTGGSITLNGGGYNNTTVNFGIGQAAYSTNAQITKCLFYGKIGNDSILVIVAFSGESTGNHQWQQFSLNSTNIVGVAANIYNSSTNNGYFMPDSGGNTTVSVYGNVGQTIEGSYSGTTQDIATSAKIAVNGTFKATREADE